MNDRIATIEDVTLCGKPHRHQWRFWVAAGNFSARDFYDQQHEFYCWRIQRVALDVGTDDPAEAEAAYERAERWVRTGELDEG